MLLRDIKTYQILLRKKNKLSIFPSPVIVYLQKIIWRSCSYLNSKLSWLWKHGTIHPLPNATWIELTRFSTRISKPTLVHNITCCFQCSIYYPLLFVKHFSIYIITCWVVILISTLPYRYILLRYVRILYIQNKWFKSHC